MANLTSLGDRKTPTRPVELTFAAELGLPSDLQELILIGHRGDDDPGSTGVIDYTVVNISNIGSVEAASGEAGEKFGDGSELAKMVIAAVRATQDLGVHPAIKCVPLAFDDTGFGPDNAALTAAARVKGEYLVSPYDAMENDDDQRADLISTAETMSGPERTENNQFGTFAVALTRQVTDPAELPSPDTYNAILIDFPDTGTGDDEPTQLVGEQAAACAARMAANPAPFNPLNNIVVTGLDVPAQNSDWITVGPAMESEAILVKGWTPLRVLPNGEEVAFVRTVTSRITTDGAGGPVVTAYYDVQDFNVLFFWRKTVYTRDKQPDFTNVKATVDKAKDLKGEMIRLAFVFQDATMFQNVAQLAPYFKVQRRASDRSTFEVRTPVNVVPGLHNILTNVEATTLFDSFVV